MSFPSSTLGTIKRSGLCSGCEDRVFWLVTFKSGTWMPVELEDPNTSHFATCPHAGEFRKTTRNAKPAAPDYHVSAHGRVVAPGLCEGCTTATWWVRSSKTDRPLMVNDDDTKHDCGRPYKWSPRPQEEEIASDDELW